LARGGDFGVELLLLLLSDLFAANDDDFAAEIGTCTAVRDELGEIEVVAAVDPPLAPVADRLADRSAMLAPVLTADLPRDSPPPPDSRPMTPGEVGATGTALAIADCKGGVSFPAPPPPDCTKYESLTSYDGRDPATGSLITRRTPDSNPP